MIQIDPTARIAQLTDIEDSVRGTRIIIGPRVFIDSFVKIKSVGGTGDVIIGADTYINSGTVIYSGNGVRIGKSTMIAANCTLAAVNHRFDRADVPIANQGFQESRGGIVTGDDVWIGANCVLLDGAIVGTGAVIGAGSVVRGNVTPFSVSAGNPLRQFRARS